MGNKMIDKAVNPFIQIAGARALAWGALGLLVSTVICYYAGYHYHGLLHFCLLYTSPSPRDCS